MMPSNSSCLVGNNGNSYGGSSTVLQANKCELPRAVHIAQISSSDEDYLDFEEAEDFEMEDEATKSSAATLNLRQYQKKSFINNKINHSNMQPTT